MAYKVELPDGSWANTDDLTGIELEAIQKATGSPWYVLNPYRDITHYRAIVAAFTLRTGMADAELVEWFNARTRKDLDAGLESVEDGDDLPVEYQDGVPLAEGEPTTTSSAGSPSRRGAGRQK